MNRIFTLLSLFFFLLSAEVSAQSLQLPDGGVNYKSMTGRRIGNTDIEIRWNAPMYLQCGRGSLRTDAARMRYGSTTERESAENMNRG